MSKVIFFFNKKSHPARQLDGYQIIITMKKTSKYNYFFFPLAFLATLNAIATACFCGLPEAISDLIFLLIVLAE